MIVTAGATNKHVYFYIQEDAGATNPGEPVTGLLFSSLDSASYARSGAARVAITLATLASASAAHSDGGFILVDDTSMAGLYRLDVPDAAYATGADQVIVQIDPGAARVCVPVVVDVTDLDMQTALTVATIVAGVWDELTSVSRTAGSYGQLHKDNINATISSRSSHGDPDPSGFIDAPISTVDTVVDAIKVVTDQMTFTVANRLDVNTRRINGAVVVGDGNATPWDGA